MVIDNTRATRGVISVKHNGHIKEVTLSNLRRHLHFMVLYSSGSRETEPTVYYPTAHENVWETVRTKLDVFRGGSFSFLGWAYQGGKNTCSPATHVKNLNS